MMMEPAFTRGLWGLSGGEAVHEDTYQDTRQPNQSQNSYLISVLYKSIDVSSVMRLLSCQTDSFLIDFYS